MLSLSFYPHPVFDIYLPEWFRFYAQMPPGAALYIVVIVAGFLVRQRYLRPYFLLTSIGLMWLTFGNEFTASIAVAVMVGWLMCVWGRRRCNRFTVDRSRSRKRTSAGVHYYPAAGTGCAGLSTTYPAYRLWVCGVGWTFANAVYFGMFALPVNMVLTDATHLDVMLLCGPGFLLFRVLHVFTDVCMGESAVSLRLDRFALYLLFAPTFRLGPLARYEHVDAQFDTCRTQVCPSLVGRGLGRVALGLAMNGVIAEVIDEWLVDPCQDNAYFFVTGFFDAAADLPTIDLVIGMYLLAFRFYLGFAGYSQIAIGLCEMTGIRLDENFRWPYLATNIRDFWRRWHISLGAWLRDYVYIPVGGRRRRGLAMLVTFMYSFLWHMPTLNMALFGLAHTGGSLVRDMWHNWWTALVSRKNNGNQGVLSGLPVRFIRLMQVMRIGWLAGVILTFHFWAVTLLIFFDSKGCGLLVLRRIFVDPVLRVVGW